MDKHRHQNRRDPYVSAPPPFRSGPQSGHDLASLLARSPPQRPRRTTCPSPSPPPPPCSWRRRRVPILLQQNAHQKLEPASVTKIMTLLLVMEAVDSGRLSLDEPVPVSAHAAGMGGSQVYLKEGEQPLRLRPHQVRGRGLGQRLRRGPGRAPCRQRVRLRGADEPKGPGPGHGGHPLCQLHRPPRPRPPHLCLRHRPHVPGAAAPPPGHPAIHDHLDRLHPKRRLRPHQYQPPDPLLRRGHRPENGLHRLRPILHVRRRPAKRHGDSSPW